MLKINNNVQSFIFNKNIPISELPGYIKHYILKGETILSAFKTSKDHGIFTDTKLILFDNEIGRKRIYTIFYKSISLVDILFEEKDAYLNIYLESGKILNITFETVAPQDKVRLRNLYTCISRVISDLKIPKEDSKKLIKNTF